MIENATELLRKGDFSAVTITLLKEIVAHQKIRELLAAMLDTAKLAGQTSENAVYQMMQIAQAVANFDKLSACLLMSQLYDFASDLYMHDVCDSIDMWIYKNHNPDLQRELRVNAPTQMNESMKRHYEEWIRG